MSEDAPHKVYQDILDTYPFLTAEETEQFKAKAAEVILSIDSGGRNQLKAIKGLLSLLNNTHAKIKRSEKPNWEISDRVLFIDIPSWNPTRGAIAADLIGACRDLKADYDGIVIDVRDNGGGGSGEAFKFAGIFFNKDMERGRFLHRNRGADLQESVGILHPNESFYTDVPLAILISKKTFSACELFLAPFKASGRATLIGEKTGGGSANPTAEGLVVDGQKFIVCIPTYRFYVTGEDKPIEETGIKPNIEYTGEDIKEMAKKLVLEKDI